jgi:hypothetical protein
MNRHAFGSVAGARQQRGDGVQLEKLERHQRVEKIAAAALVDSDPPHHVADGSIHGDRIGLRHDGPEAEPAVLIGLGPGARQKSATGR